MQLPIWERYPNYLDNYLDAIRIFLDGYAFERQGRNPSYSHAAIDAINAVYSYQPRQEFPEIVWKNFSGLLPGKGLNINVNPLFHKETQCSCVWCKTKSENLIVKAIEALRNSRVKEIWEEIKYIRGIGPKIASLFLRDISVQFGLNPLQNRWLLQPVDIWVRRTAFILSSKKVNDEDLAKFIVENCNEPEKINQGIWYFSTQIAGSEFKLSKSLQDLDYARKILFKHIKSLKDAAASMEDS